MSIQMAVSSVPGRRVATVGRPLSYSQRRTRTSAKGKPVDTASDESTESGLIFSSGGFTDSAISKSLPSQGLDVSLARQGYTERCEAQVNEQINVEYAASYMYHAMAAYFNRDNQTRPGLAKYFTEASNEERGHAVKLMEYQAMRGGKVSLGGLSAPNAASDTLSAAAPSCDALTAMEITLGLEKLNYQKLLELHQVASDENDAQLCDFVESELLAEQVEAVYEVSKMVTTLRRIGTDEHGIWAWDKELSESESS